MNPLIDHIYNTNRVEDLEGNAFNAFPESASRDVGLTLYNLVRETNSENTLEVGMAYGLSTLHICQAHHDKGAGGHTAIDPSQRSKWRSIGLLNLSRAGLDNFFTFYENPSYEILPQLLRNGERYDFVFVDGLHLFDYTLVDFFYTDKLLKSGGFVMFDDLWMPAIRKVCGFILRNRNYKLAPESLWAQAPLWKRGLRFARSVGQNPIDVYSLYFAALMAAKGFFKYCVLEKISDDDRKWDFHKCF